MTREEKRAGRVGCVDLKVKFWFAWVPKNGNHPESVYHEINATRREE